MTAAADRVARAFAQVQQARLKACAQEALLQLEHARIALQQFALQHQNSPGEGLKDSVAVVAAIDSLVESLGDVRDHLGSDRGQRATDKAEDVSQCHRSALNFGGQVRAGQEHGDAGRDEERHVYTSFSVYPKQRRSTAAGLGHRAKKRVGDFLGHFISGSAVRERVFHSSPSLDAGTSSVGEPGVSDPTPDTPGQVLWGTAAVDSFLGRRDAQQRYAGGAQ